MTRAFTITFDYLCPFARIANEIVVEAVDAGADWSVVFAPFSLSQAHVDEDQPDAWDLPAGTPGRRGITGLEWAIAVRDEFPERFTSFHVRLFDARHSSGADVDDPTVLREVAGASGLDPDAVAAVVDRGTPRKTLAAEHGALVDGHAVFGVPTFIAGDEAVFVRLMERHRRGDVERVLDMLEWSRLNEFKRTRIPR